jgi:uncharacterized repeat protein (TIGR03803 family)
LVSQDFLATIHGCSGSFPAKDPVAKCASPSFCLPGFYEAAKSRAFFLLTKWGRGMKLNISKFVCILCVFCATTAIVSSAQTLTTLVSFNGSNGSDPGYGPLVQGNDGNFYGTTREGGSGCNDSGTVFKMTPGGMLTTLYNFCTQLNCVDGAQPYAGLVEGSDGNFYGTTGSPLAIDWVFKITPQGAITLLSMTDGGFPFAALVQGVDGNFYGTTASGGSGDVGTVFRITPSGTQTMLHSFEGYPTDGAAPGIGALVQATDGNFYGTTQYGGANNGCIETCGTVFKITPQGAETTLYSFSCLPPDCPGGFSPAGGLVQGTDGNFYGTTQYGGTSTTALMAVARSSRSRPRAS